jgi:hypothetical protein
LSDTQVARDFVAADAVLAVDKHPQRRQPLVQSDRTVFEDAPDLDGELLFASTALPERTSAQAIAGVLVGSAGGAYDAIRPAKRSYKGDAGFNIGEVADCSEQGVGSGVFGNHATRIAALGW